MNKIKKQNTISCIVNAKFNNYRIGDIIQIYKGYAQYLYNQNLIILIAKNSNTESVLNNKIFIKINVEIQKLSLLKTFTIERKTKGKENLLFQKITPENIMYFICKKNEINFYNCFHLKINDFQNNKDAINITQCGKYTCDIYCKDKQLVTIKLIVLSTTNSNYK